MKKILILFCLIISISSLRCQDIHWSQILQNETFFNPAQIGLNSNIIRLYTSAKLQWYSVTKPYQTYLLSTDGQILRRQPYMDKLSGNLIVFREFAGDASYGTTSIALGLSYFKGLEGRYFHIISLGLQGWYNFRSFDFNKLYFGDQYNGDVFDPTLQTNEQYIDEKLSYFTATIGIAYQLYFSNEQFLEINYALANIGNANISNSNGSRFILSLNHRSSIRYYNEKLLKRNYLDAMLYYSYQKPFWELIPILKIMKPIEKNNSIKSIGGFIGDRINDAIIVGFAIDGRDWQGQISYDINTSSLNKASYGRGGFELSIYKYFNPPKIEKNKYKILCPIF
ncbi:MAG: type IX secretion system membrane protein PorP/SprF [Bacteroidales bacterium]|jgi:type IX secretion system PorP/SprF family membrane protein|nr:type IX secretion system membrane protein PorP/SprF [Bacteroidales bacterium]MDI9575753.1 type IX secretion system membrane protein PorP/SprF [Bacteroidota bacterium]MDD2593695.1 type IX secretion system membrane protein PorP/SprF [Bacteroidales bacterium]MDD3755352.1 type IX secretion system membrane protein PorP/SprF [Bacteroidales bacterium]MDY0401016.1 type IX secretion system membrane protein PorP/SprF [Bacteroidales bacterium]